VARANIQAPQVQCRAQQRRQRARHQIPATHKIHIHEILMRAAQLQQPQRRTLVREQRFHRRRSERERHKAA
jgi:hypothetical protein